MSVAAVGRRGSWPSRSPACSPTDGAAVTYPVGSVGPDRTVSPAVAQTRGQLVQVLGGQNLILNDTHVAVPAARVGDRSRRRRGPSTR